MLSVSHFCLFGASVWRRKPPQVFICSILLMGPTSYRKAHFSLPPTKQSLSLRHNKALACIPPARSWLLLRHMASRAREGCQPVRQTSYLGSTDGSVGHVSRGAQHAQTASKHSPGTASVCKGLIELGSCDRVPQNIGVEADKGFFRRPRSNDSGHLVL